MHGWRDALLLVKPETVLRWHREGFRLFWRWKSRSRYAPEPKISDDVVALIRRMARENRLWGAERIRGELLKLGITVAKRTIQRYMRAARLPVPPRGQSWKTFLANHTVWACDFLQVYDVWFRPLFAFFVIDIKSREVIHVAATRQPSAPGDRATNPDPGTPRDHAIEVSIPMALRGPSFGWGSNRGRGSGQVLLRVSNRRRSSTCPRERMSRQSRIRSADRG